MISKVLSEKLKNFETRFTLFAMNSVNVKSKYIGESWRVIFDFMEIAKIRKLKWIITYNGHSKSILIIRS